MVKYEKDALFSLPTVFTFLVKTWPKIIPQGRFFSEKSNQWVDDILQYCRYNFLRKEVIDSMDETEYTLYSEVKSQPVEWLWYPYIPYGKITLLQGDPGDGKSTMIVNLISTLSTSGYMPSGNKLPFPVKTIYQCSEDGIEDTIKPRLERYGADCRKVAFISEQESPLKISDDS